MSHSKPSSQATPARAVKVRTAAVAKRKMALPGVPKGKLALPKRTDWKHSYLSVYRASPLERISWIKKGIPAVEAKRLFVDLPIGQGVGFKALNLPIATVNKKAKQGETLSREESERVVGFARLVGQLEAIIQESGDPTGFDARAWMARWLTEPLPALGGVRPVDLIDTMEGQGLVSSALAMLQSGAYF